MSDIALRFNYDMLVLSEPMDRELQVQGFTDEADRAYVVLCEPELIEESFRFEQIIATPCFVTPTEDITNARLAHARFEGQAHDMALHAYEAAARFSPQHIIAAVAPTGLPLDEWSAPSLKQSKLQYHDAVRALMEFPFDALFFSGFQNPIDAQCALMGARSIYDGPIMLSFSLTSDATLPGSRHDLGAAVSRADEYGADVIGIRSAAAIDELEETIDLLKARTDKPLLVELVVGRHDERQFAPTSENPYPIPDTMVDAALKLRAWGVQFLRAVGDATPSYTGALVAATSGLDVVGSFRGDAHGQA